MRWGMAFIFLALACGDDGGVDDPIMDASATDHGGGGDAGPSDLGPVGMDAPVGSPDFGMPGGGCGTVPADRDPTIRIMHDGVRRTFDVHVPPSYDGSAPLPLVIGFHGRMLNGSIQNGISGMNDLADEEGFLTAHPQGVSSTWNGGNCCGDAASRDIDDVGFTSAIIDWFDANLCLDTARVYATGFSNGGLMAHRVGCDLSDRITAIAPVGGQNATRSCDPVRPVPMYSFHGTNDSFSPYNGFSGGTSAPEAAADWAARNGCGETPTVYFMNGDVTCEEYTECDQDARSRLCTIEGGGHQWPGGSSLPGLGSNTDAIDATREMWDFFQRYAIE